MGAFSWKLYYYVKVFVWLLPARNTYQTLQIKIIENWKVGFWGRGRTREPREKSLGIRTKERRTYSITWSGIEPESHWWEVRVLSSLCNLGFAVVVFLISLMWLVNPNVTCTFYHKDKLLKGWVGRPGFNRGKVWVSS